MNYMDYSSKSFEEAYTYPGSDLGSTWTKEASLFRLWSPIANCVELLLYRTGWENKNDLIDCIPMSSDQNGTWVARADGDLNGVFYTYRIHLDGYVVEAPDPYGHASGVNGKRSMVIDLRSTDPVDWETDCPPRTSNDPTSYVIYELHIRDFSVDRSGRIHNKGKYLSLTETGTKTTKGSPTGLSYIKALGITHVHLMPVYDFGSVDESAPERRQYNWGYDPVCYNVPEGSYATDPYDGVCRIREMKQMVHALHKNGLAVIMDVVYNHVYHTEEFSMNRLASGYFSRQDAQGRYSNGSICGNDTASERSMVRKFIVDSVNFWADEYHMDGFRFDLVGLLDTVTISEIIRTVHKKHPHVFFYGEGWEMPTCLTKDGIQLATQKNSALLPEFAFFNDTMRDTIRGSVFDSHASGYISGGYVDKWHLLECFCGRTPWTDQPKKIINYISCHDNHTLFDRVATVIPDASQEEIAKRCRLGAAFNLLSMGVPFFQAGEELLRKKRDRSGRIIHNSYQSSDSVNAIRWGTLCDPDVSATMKYYRGILELRRNHTLFRMSDPELIAKCIEMLDTETEIMAFQLSGPKEKIIAAFHPGTESQWLNLPDGKWSILVKDDIAGDRELGKAEGCIILSPLSVMVLCKKQTHEIVDDEHI